METNTDHWRKNNEQKLYLHLIVREDKQQASVPGKTEKHLSENGQTKMIKNKTLLETAMQWFGHEWIWTDYWDHIICAAFSQAAYHFLFVVCNNHVYIALYRELTTLVMNNALWQTSISCCKTGKLVPASNTVWPQALIKSISVKPMWSDQCHKNQNNSKPGTYACNHLHITANTVFTKTCTGHYKKNKHWDVIRKQILKILYTENDHVKKFELETK